MQEKFTIVHKILSVFQSFPPKASLSLPKTSDPLKKFPPQGMRPAAGLRTPVDSSILTQCDLSRVVVKQ